MTNKGTELLLLIFGMAVGSMVAPEVIQDGPPPIAMAGTKTTAPPSNGRTCYGCIGWCTYGRMCTPPDNIQWHDVATELGISGQGWPTAQMASPFNRFPAKVCASAHTHTHTHTPCNTHTVPYHIPL